jgi:hypothetical protein
MAVSVTTAVGSVRIHASRRLRVIVNAVAVQITWFAAVLGAARGWWWLGLVSMAILIAWHLLSSAQPLIELRLLLFAGGIGAFGDSVLTASGLMRVASGGADGYLTSAWMIALWIAFATSLTLGLCFLRRWSWWQVAGLGAISAVLSYYGGVRLGAVNLPNGTVLGLVGVGVLWACAMPVLVSQSRRVSNE